MKTRLLLAIAFLLGCVACQAQTTKKQANMENKKMLVVFFSHAGDNYAVGNIKVGNTKIVAEYISELTGADRYEIETSKYDGMAYKPLCDLAQEEQIQDARPSFTGKIVSADGKVIVAAPTQANFDKYDVVFVGGPVWWGTYPQVMFTFFDTFSLNGKTIYPFTTHEGSGLGNCVSDVRQNYPKADVQRGFSMYGHEVRSGKQKVEKWINGLNL